MARKKSSSYGFEFLVVLAITIAAAVLYFIWLGDVKDFAESAEDHTICKNSNIENAKLKLKIPATNQVITERSGNKCRTEYLTVPKGKETDVTAKKMAQCWDMYLEGKEELFDTEDNNYCAVCSVLTYKDTKQIDGLTQYLLTQKGPLTRGKTYYHYMTNVVVTNDILQELENHELKKYDTINVQNPQAVIFTMGKNAYPGSTIEEGKIFSTGGGVAIGGALGAIAFVLGTAFCTTGVGCVLTLMVLGGTAGGTIGYSLGSSYSADTESRIVLWSYTNQDMAKLKCTVLEGRDQLTIRKF